MIPDARSSESAVLALDVGGSRMAAGIVAGNATVLAEACTPTPSTGSGSGSTGSGSGSTGSGSDAEAVYDAAVFVLNAVLTEARIPISALGVGCGGPMQWPSGDVSPLNIPAWRDFPLLERLSEDFGLPVRVHNDAICLTIGEHLAGAGRGRDNVMGMVVSTGVGGGLILDGRLVDGTSGNAGHIGHVVIDPEGPPCGCGGRGCLEAVARGPAVVAWAREQGWHGPSDADGAVLAGAARSGDAVAVAAFRRCGDALGTAIASAAALLDLELVAIGGGISYAADLVLPALFDAFERHAGFEFVRRCRIVLAASSSRLVGAAGLFAEGYWHGDAPALTESRMNPSS